MKIGIYSDCHYSSARITCGTRYNSRSLRKIKEAYRQFESSGCELAVCLGDLIDTELTVEKEMQNLREIADVINASSIPTVCLMGNHDAFVLEREKFYDVLGIDDIRELHMNDIALLFLDACYFKSGKHYSPGDSDWTDSFYPDEALLRASLSDSAEHVCIFVHQNIDPAIREDHRIYNADKLFELINLSGKVKAVFQGHYHPGHRSSYDGVEYVTIPAMCENEKAYFVFDI